MNIFEKIKFILGRPKVVIVAGGNSQVTAGIISRVLGPHFKIGLHPPATLTLSRAPKVLVFGSDLEDLEKIKFLIGKSSLPVLVATKYNEKIRELTRIIPAQGFLVLNSDEKEGLEEIKNGSTVHCLTFGFQEKANFQASDIKENGRTNFKISYDGKVVPVWLEKSTDKEGISAALAAATVGTIFGLNLVEISQAL